MISMVEVRKGVAPVTIVLDTEEEIDLFFHILNFAPNKEDHYPFDGYKATFKEVQQFRKELWEDFEALGIRPKMERDC